MNCHWTLSYNDLRYLLKLIYLILISDVILYNKQSITNACLVMLPGALLNYNIVMLLFLQSLMSKYTTKNLKLQTLPNLL